MRITDNLYWDNNSSDRMVIPPKRNPSYATSNQVLDGYGYKDAQTKELLVGSMPINKEQHIALGAGDIYIIPVGYHNGRSTVTVLPFEEMTQATATEDDIVFNKSAWANGRLLIGKLDLNQNEMIASATENDIIDGKTAWVKKVLLTGKIPRIMREDHSLLAGETYVIPYGLHGGEAIVKATDLKSQTPGNATEDNISEDAKAWVNGELIIGKLKRFEDRIANATALSKDIRKNRTAYCALGLTEGSMDEYLNRPVKLLSAGDTFTIPLGYHDGLWIIQCDSLANQTKTDATENDIRLGKFAWANGVLVEGKMTQVSVEDTKGTATEYDIAEGEIAWVNGIEIVGKSPYNTVYFNRIINGKDNPDDPISITLPEHNWNNISSIDVLIFDQNDTLKYNYHYDHFISGSVALENDGENSVLNITTIIGSPIITIASFVPDSYMMIMINNYTVITE